MRLPAVLAVLAGVLASSVFAKLPPLSDEAKAKAAEAAVKSAWTDKVGLYKLCAAMDRTAETYRSRAKMGATPAPAADPMPGCADPGPFIAPVAEAAKPLEAAGAHSPPAMATSPPSGKATSAEVTGVRK